MQTRCEKCHEFKQTLFNDLLTCRVSYTLTLLGLQYINGCPSIFDDTIHSHVPVSGGALKSTCVSKERRSLDVRRHGAYFTIKKQSFETFNPHRARRLPSFPLVMFLHLVTTCCCTCTRTKFYGNCYMFNVRSVFSYTLLLECSIRLLLRKEHIFVFYRERLNIGRKKGKI